MNIGFKYPSCLLLALVLLMSGCGSDSPPDTSTGTSADTAKPHSKRLGQGDIAPEWRGVDLVDGKTVAFPELLEGKPAVLLFWATWCPYCKAFMPYAQKIQADYEGSGVKIVTFNTKERGRGDPKAYARSLGFPLIAIADADSIAATYNVDFIPGLMVVDGNGQITYRRRSTNLPAGKTVGQLWDDEVRAALDQLVQPE